MPALPDVPGVLRLDLHQSLSEDSNIVNRFFYAYSGAPSTTDFATWLGHLNADLTANYGVLGTTHLQYNEGVLTDLTTSSGFRASVPLTVAGASTNAPLPAETCMVIRFTIGRRYRGGKPKAFLAGPNATQLADEERWASASGLLWQNNFASFQAAWIAHAPAGFGTVAHVSVSYFQSFSVVISPTTGRARNVPTLRGTPIVDHVTGYVYDPRPGSQRRRSLQGT